MTTVCTSTDRGIVGVDDGASVRPKHDERASGSSCVTPAQFQARLREDISSGRALLPGTSTQWPMSFQMQRYRDGMLADWLDWLAPQRSGSTVVGEEKLGYPIPDSLIEASSSMHRIVVERLLNIRYDAKRFAHVDFHNATDYAFQTILGGAKHVLDFGAGYGRQAFLWTSRNASLTYVAVDGIEGPYVLQNRVFRCLTGVSLSDYIQEPSTFAVGAVEDDVRKVCHLPTWRLDLLPSGFFDLIICAQVLQELNGPLVRPLLDQFKRVIAPGGRLYIRDHEYYRPAHRFKIGKYLLRNGWRLAFRYPGIDKHDIHGIPRIWRYTGEDTSELLGLRSILKRHIWLAAPWTRYWSDTGSRRQSALRRGLFHYLRRGRPRVDDLFDSILPM